MSRKILFQAFWVNMSGTVMDLSARGICSATDFRLDVGTEIMLVFSLSGEKRIWSRQKAWFAGQTARRRERRAITLRDSDSSSPS